MTHSTSTRAILLSISLIAAVSTPLLTLSTTASARSLVNASLSSAVVPFTKRLDYSGCLGIYISGDSIDVPSFLGTSSGCYELRLNGVPVSLKKQWSLQQAIADLEQQKLNHPRDIVEGYFNDIEVGYELYWDGVRVGYEPSWTLAEAIANIEWNKATYPDKHIDGYFYGFSVGYELYRDGVRINYEPSWTYQQALEDFQEQQQACPDKVIQGFYNGTLLPQE